MPLYLSGCQPFCGQFFPRQGWQGEAGADGSAVTRVTASGGGSCARLPVFPSCSAARFLAGPGQFAAGGRGPLLYMTYMTLQLYMTKLGLFQECKTDWNNNQHKQITHNHISREIDRVPKR